MKKTAFALALSALAPVALAAVPTGKYLMSFHACNVSTTDCNNASLTLSATVTIAAGDVGKAGSFYVAALYNDSWYANNGSAWALWPGGALPAFSTSSAFASSHALPILQNANVVGLKGVQIYAGYGTSLDDMLNNTKYGLVYNVP